MTEAVIDNTILPLYTEAAKNVIAAAVTLWQDHHKHTGLSNILAVKFDDYVAITGEVVLMNTKLDTDDMIRLKQAVKEYILEGVFLETRDIIREGGSLPSIAYTYVAKKISEEERHNRHSKEGGLAHIRATRGIYREFDKMEYADVRIGDAWIVYDLLNGASKSDLAKEYGAENVEKVIGSPRNPMQIELVKLKNEEKAKIMEEISAETRKKSDEIHRQKYALEAELEKFLEEQDEKEKAEIDKIEEKYKKLLQNS